MPTVWLTAGVIITSAVVTTMKPDNWMTRLSREARGGKANMPMPVRRTKVTPKAGNTPPWLGPDVAEVRTFDRHGDLIGAFIRVGQRWGEVKS
jgi:hypothetical protein